MKGTADSDNSEVPCFEQSKSGISHHLLADARYVEAKREKYLHTTESKNAKPPNEKYEVESEAAIKEYRVRKQKAKEVLTKTLQ